MKILYAIIEFILSPLTAFLKFASNSKTNLSSFAKTGVIFVIALILVVCFIFIFYRSYIFR